jgi:hypothetical protein
MNRVQSTTFLTQEILKNTQESLDSIKNFLYTENMFHLNPLIAKRVLKAAWHINTVTGEVFY